MYFRSQKKLPPPRSLDHRINIKEGDSAIKQHPYRYPFIQRKEIEKMVNEMLDTGVIQPSNSPYSSPVLLVKKKDGSWRICIDYRKLNSITIKDSYPIPLIEDLMDELGQARVFSKIDLRSGYHQIRMHPMDIYKTTFVTVSRLYEFTVMPFGLTNAPATFQAIMNQVFNAHLRDFILVFFDDILIYSQNMEEHKEHLQKTLQLLRENQLLAKASKCSFGQTQIKYLGHIISDKGVQADPAKIQVMKDWHVPTSVKAGFLDSLVITGSL